MRLIVVRHGQTACNVNNMWHGWDECALTAEGEAQAAAVGTRLAGEPITAIYSSPSRRARQTADAVARRHGLGPVVEPGLRERSAGDYEGVSVAEVERVRPTIWQERDADLWGWRPPGGESFREVLQRTTEVLDRIRACHPDETVALVTHMGPARMLLNHLTGTSLEETYRMTFPSTSVSIYRFDGSDVTVEALNDAAHTA